MNKMIRIIAPVAVSAMLVMLLGCGTSSTTREADDTNGKAQDTDQQNGEFTPTDYDLGLTEGYDGGYEQGYIDGKAGTYNPEPGNADGVNADYETGYREGYAEGYDDGYNDAQAQLATGDETARVEAAMLSFVKSNAVPGLEFRIENIVIHGDEAAGIAVCTSEKLENALVVMKKGETGWYGVDFGTGIEPPAWYTY